MPLVPTFDMAAADAADFGLEELPDLEDLENGSVDPGPSARPRRDGMWRCTFCDSDSLLPDYLGRYRCVECGTYEAYRVDMPTVRPTAHGKGEWHYVPRGQEPPLPPAGDPRGDPPRQPQGGPAAGRRNRRRRRHAGRGPPGEDGTSEFSEQPESEALTFDPTVSVGASSLTSRRAERHDPVSPRRPDRQPRPADRHVAEPPRLPDHGLPDPLREHPQHLVTLDDVKAASPDKRSKGSTPSWNSRMGPEKNVRWRGGTPPAPPAWRYDVSDLRAFSKRARKVEIWRVQISSYMTSREAALYLYTSLTGEAEAELEHVPIDKINHEDGIDFILRSLKEPMEQKSIFQKRKFLSDFEQLSRYPNEGLRTFANRYRRVERSLEALGVNITAMYDTEARGNRLLERARLTHADQRLILVGARYSLNFKGAPPVVNKDGSLVTRNPVAGKEKGGGKGAHGQPAAQPGKGGLPRQPRPPDAAPKGVHCRARGRAGAARGRGAARRAAPGARRHARRPGRRPERPPRGRAPRGGRRVAGLDGSCGGVDGDRQAPLRTEAGEEVHRRPSKGHPLP